MTLQAWMTSHFAVSGSHSGLQPKGDYDSSIRWSTSSAAPKSHSGLQPKGDYDHMNREVRMTEVQPRPIADFSRKAIMTEGHICCCSDIPIVP